MKIALFQVDIIWESPIENCRRYSELLEKYFLTKGGTGSAMPDIIVFPEFFTTGFTMNTSFAESTSGISVEWMRNISKKYNVAIVASVPIREGEKVFNRCFFIAPDGQEHYYDKRHLFRMGAESEYFMAGNLSTVISYKSWNIALNICYDLRFPIWSRNVDLGYDIMINVASWPSARISVVEHLAKARALENLSYYVFLNRVGEDVDNTYTGQSRVVDYLGNDIGEEEVMDGVSVYTASLKIDKLKEFRNKFPAWKDADTFKII